MNYLYLPRDIINEIFCFINDSFTFRNLCLSCKLFNQIGRKYVDLKKNQFGRIIFIGFASWFQHGSCQSTEEQIELMKQTANEQYPYKELNLLINLDIQEVDQQH